MAGRNHSSPMDCLIRSDHRFQLHTNKTKLLHTVRLNHSSISLSEYF